MTKQVINPIIQLDSVDTLNDSKHCLSFLIESLDEPPQYQKELSSEARHGLIVMLDVVRQAIQFEQCRQNSSDELSHVFQQLSSVEKSLADRSSSIV